MLGPLRLVIFLILLICVLLNVKLMLETSMTKYSKEKEYVAAKQFPA